MHVKEFSARVVTFKLAAALEKYEMDLRALAEPWIEPEVFRRLHEQFGELRMLGASLPRPRLEADACSRPHPARAAARARMAKGRSVRGNCVMRGF